MEDTFADLLNLVGDAIGVADDAVKEADAKKVEATESVVLTKVAADRYHAVASSIIKTGSFPGVSAEQLAKNLEEGGLVSLLDTMEKLASRAVFPFGSDEDLGGELVEKSATNQTVDKAETNTAMWRRSLDEAELECAG